eukprot:5749597-Karenia_brevis.AAC.1
MNLTRMSEDCLMLNVFAPRVDLAKHQHTSLPVLVWFHAGEFVYGTANDKESAFPFFANNRRMIYSFSER